MKIKDLKRKLDLLSEDADDYEVLINAGDANLLYLGAVHVGSMWNVVLSADEEDDDIEDEIAQDAMK